MRIIYLQRRSLVSSAIILILLLAAAALLLRSQTVAGAQKILPVYEVATEQPLVALSFDASWGAEYTPQLLDILDEYQVKTTFFLVNIWVEDYPELTREIIARGHEIGLHSVSHPHFTELTNDQIYQELEDNYQLINQTAGCCPTLFRPPFGDYDSRVVEQVNACGYQCIQWSIDSLDWKDLSADEIYQRVAPKLSAGDIVLFHNNGLHTAEALSPILQYITEQGLTAVPVSELLLDGETYVDANGVQHPAAASAEPAS